jgi:hypothetical protein
MLINRLTLDRDALLKWKKWTGPAKKYLRAKEEHFDLGPVIESYVNTAAAFFNWFVEEVNKRNPEIKTAYMEAADAYVSWYEERDGHEYRGVSQTLWGRPVEVTRVSDAAGASSRSGRRSDSAGRSDPPSILWIFPKKGVPRLRTLRGGLSVFPGSSERKHAWFSVSESSRGGSHAVYRSRLNPCLSMSLDRALTACVDDRRPHRCEGIN